MRLEEIIADMRQARERRSVSTWASDRVYALLDAYDAAIAEGQVLGYVNIYEEDGKPVIGAGDIDGIDEPVWAEEFMIYLGKGKIVLIPKAMDR